MPPIGEERGAAWASLNIHFLWALDKLFVALVRAPVEQLISLKQKV
jgi:hypothetical protein